MMPADMDDLNPREHTINVPVLIIGAGPTGLLLAYMLSRLNGKSIFTFSQKTSSSIWHLGLIDFAVQTLIAEKYPTRLAAPKAHALSPRSLEICRQYGLDTAALRRLGTRREEAYWVNFCVNLSGERVGRLPYERMDAGVLQDTPEMIHNIPQPGFEQFIANELAHSSNVEIRKGLAYVTSSQIGGDVLTTLEERDTGRKLKVRSGFVVGCDGTRSTVRQDLGIESEGEDSEEMMMTIHFDADLKSLVPDSPGMLHWILDPATSGFIIAYDSSSTHVLISNFDARKNPPESWNLEHVEAVLLGAIGQRLNWKVHSWRPWIFGRKVAKDYRKQNVFLAGDAAHSFPPTGGLGLNTGLGDVHNLASKLAAVYHGSAGRALLETYTADRRPVADVCAKQSDKNGKKIFGFLKSLGTAGVANVEEARKNLLISIRSPEKQAEIAAHVEGQREHFDNLELHIGYVYGDPRPPNNASDYTAKFVPGARMPHAFVDWTGTASDSAWQLPSLDLSFISEVSEERLRRYRYSTLDLCRPDTFTLLVSHATSWLGNIDSAKADLDVKNVKFEAFRVGADFEFVDDNHVRLFAEGCFNQGCGLLMRPDQHILAQVTEDDDVADIIMKYLRLS